MYNRKTDAERKSKRVALRFRIDEYNMISVDLERTGQTMQDYCAAAILCRARDKMHVEPEVNK